MAETEKITINLGVVDLGKIDLLVAQGFYSNRTDLIRTAIRNQIDSHSRELDETIRHKMMVLGVLSYNKAELEKKQEQGKMLDIVVVGMLHLEDDVFPELAKATINSIKIFGVLKMPKAVEKALSGRIS